VTDTFQDEKRILLDCLHQHLSASAHSTASWLPPYKYECGFFCGWMLRPFPLFFPFCLVTGHFQASAQMPPRGI
jgi:hypothetical protein